MSSAAAFSRLQLAAALLEYDNDPNDPTAPYRSAQDSAIFAHFRRNPAARPGPKPNYLGVSVPSEAGSLGGRESALEARRSRGSRGSRGSMDALRNPFGADHNSESEEEDREDPAIEVDLASWGLDAFIPKEKSKSAKSRGKQPIPPPMVSTRSHRPSTNHDSAIPLPRSGVVTSRPSSAGGNLDFATRHVPLQTSDRRRSFGSPLDLVGMEPIGPPFRHRAVSQASSPPHSTAVPFPSSSVRSPSPGVDQSYGDPRPRPHERAVSMASMASRLIYDDMTQENIQSEQIASNMGLENAVEDNPFTIHHPSHISRFDPKVLARTRTYSNISMGSRMILENDNGSVMTGRDAYSREPRYATTMDLLRPKVLVMPSPLQAVSPSVPEQPTRIARDGFEFSTDGPPLPPGARSSRRLSSTSIMETEIVPLASNPFIPNPHIDLSLSQKTFRSTLVVGGQSGTYPDVDRGLPRATEDGQQVMVEEAPEEDVLPSVLPPEEDSKALRPAGKLYGKSLIDDLESRKAQMRSKQRVFTGDERPSMMARPQRASTLIDPASLQTRPISKRLSSYGSSQALGRQNSLSMKPLLNFEDEDGKARQPPPVAGRLPNSRTVFGVDTLWEREMAKLKEIEAQEVREKEARLKLEEETGRTHIEKKRKHKKKGRHQKDGEDVQQVSTNARVSVDPPTLPDIRPATRSVPPKALANDSTSESEEDGEQPQPRAITPAWHESSSDDENAGPRRTTGVGPRYPKHSHKISVSRDSDSEEDLPLAATIHKVAARAALGVTQARRDSDDEDRPLSHIIMQKGKLPPPRSTFHAENQPADDDDDDQPLGLRASQFVQSRPNADDEDDLPLAFHPEQQRRTQYQMLAQQHQHQQQMMIQAQMQSNMLMSASMMGPGYFAPLVHPMGMMQVPMPIPSPPPMHDEIKFGRVDRWRRDIVVDE